MARRNNVLVILGLAFFVLGAAIVFLLVEDEDDGTASASSGRATTVLVAKDAISAGMSGSDAVEQRLIETKAVGADEVAPGALTSTASLTGQVFASDVPSGTQLTATALRPAQIRGRAINIPEGMQAVAVQLDFVPGVAGYVGAGDRVNVYAVGGGETQEILSGVEVLDVSIEVAPRVASPEPGAERPTGNPITYLLALDQGQTQSLVSADNTQSLYLALTVSGQGG